MQCGPVSWTKKPPTILFEDSGIALTLARTNYPLVPPRCGSLLDVNAAPTAWRMRRKKSNRRGSGLCSLLAVGLICSCGSRSGPPVSPGDPSDAPESSKVSAGEVNEEKVDTGDAPVTSVDTPPDCDEVPGTAPTAAFDEPGQGCRVEMGDWDAVLARARGQLTYGFGPECSSRDAERCEAACANDDVAACVSLVNAYMRGLEVDLTEAVRRVAEACSLDDADACLAMSNVWFHGLGGRTTSRPEAFLTRQRGCELGQGAACAMLGHMYKNGGDGIEQDVERGFDLLVRGCRMGSIAACNDYGWSMVSDTWGKPRDVERALVFFTFSCARGLAFGCGSLGEAFEKGWGVPVDRRLAQAFWALQCDHHAHPGACAAATQLEE